MTTRDWSAVSVTSVITQPAITKMPFCPSLGFHLAIRSRSRIWVSANARIYRERGAP